MRSLGLKFFNAFHRLFPIGFGHDIQLSAKEVIREIRSARLLGPENGYEIIVERVPRPLWHLKGLWIVHLQYAPPPVDPRFAKLIKGL